MLKRTTPLVATMALTMGGALIGAASVQASDSASALATTPTRYAFQASGYGSRVVGGDVPAGSDRSAFQVIACTNKAGLDRTNAELEVDLGQDVALRNVRTHVWTSQAGGRESSWATHRIASVTLGDTAASGLVLQGVTSSAHAWHDGTGFHARTTTNVARIVQYTAGVGTELDVPADGETLDVPGVATVTVNRGATSKGDHFAAAKVDAVRLTLTPTNTRVFLAHSYARIDDGVRNALFRGSSYATKASGLEDTVRSGPTPYLVMPCQGTNGRVVTKSIAHADLSKLVDAQGLTVSQSASVENRVADAFERARVARIDITDELFIEAVVAKAHVVRTADGVYRKDSIGTSTGRIMYRGTQQAIPASGVLRIPGVARIESNLVNRTPRGIETTGLRVTVLDGSAAVVTIAHAQVSIGPSGL